MGEKNQNLTSENSKIAFFTDFDDTFFLAGEPERTAENMRAIFELRETGNVATLASGRSLSSLMRNCPEFISCFDYLILDNGAICFEPIKTEVEITTEAIPENLRELFSCTISVELCDEIVKFLRLKFPETEFAGIFYYDSCEHKLPKKAMTKIRLWTTDAEIAEKAAEEIEKNFGAKLHVFLAKNRRSTGIPWISTEYNSFIDLAAVEAGKERAIEKLATMKFPKARIITIGDGDNDIGMLEKFDGFAVENAEVGTKKAVKSEHIVESVAELVEKVTKGEI